MTNLQEIWKDINGYEGFYQISNEGNIKSIERKIKYGKNHAPAIKPEQLLKPKLKKAGYLFVSLCKDADIKYFHVHRLVAQAFIDNPENKPLVNHIDGNKLNNNVTNLEWATPKENVSHYLTKIKTGTKRYTKHKISKNEKRVNQLSLDGKFIKTWENMSEPARFLNCSMRGISRVANKKRGGKTFYGFKWEFALP